MSATMPVEVVIQALEAHGSRVHRKGDGAEAQCSAHEDGKASLSISTGRDGRAILNCFAGCVVEDVVAAIGLRMTDLFADEPKKARTIVAEYDYTDEQGELIFQVVRFEPKAFMQRRPDGHGGWIWKLGDTRRVLYHLPAIEKVRATVPWEEQPTVFIVEGEKDVQALEKAGHVATCNPAGAGKWLPQYADQLKGIDHLVIIADRDAPGRKHAMDVEAQLATDDIDSEVLEPAEGKDISDHLRAGLGIEDLGPLVDDETSEESSEVVGDDGTLLFRRISIRELMAQDATMHWLIKDWITDPTYGTLAGGSKTLKTYLSMYQALGLASGRSIFGHFEVPKPESVLIYVGEGGSIPYRRRLERVASSMGILSPEDLPIHLSFDIAPIGSDKFFESLQRDLEELEPKLFILDPLYAYHGTSTDVKNLHDEGALLTKLSSQCGEAGASSEVVNHFNQTGSGLNLNRITMTGGAEWSDTWTLVEHRESPDPDAGLFQLKFDIGSRQWGGRTWELDLNIGRLDIDTGIHDGDITFELRRHVPVSKGGSLEHEVICTVSDMPYMLTRAGVKKEVGGKGQEVGQMVDRLVENGRLWSQKVPRLEGGKMVPRDLLALAGVYPFETPVPDERTGVKC